MWPEIAAPELRARLTLDDDAFLAWVEAAAAAVPARDSGPAAVAHALGYPWTRPDRSFRLASGTVTLLDDLDPATRAATIAAGTTAGSGRVPLLAFGSNAAPAALERKFAHFPDPADRELLVVTGELHDHDVGASAMPALLYGALPATLVRRPGTRVRAALLWVTPAQFTQLTWSELSYRLGRLAGARFAADDGPDGDADAPLAYVSRFGAFAVDGQTVALAAVPAAGRTLTALTQEELLTAAARLALGPGAAAADLVRLCLTDAAAVFAACAPVRAAGQPYGDVGFTPYPRERSAPAGPAAG